MKADTYRTILKTNAGPVYKDKKSKFYGFAFPVADAKSIKNNLDQLHLQHPTARHICYAWRTGTENPDYRLSDDGEPHNSAGQPIFGQIRAFDLTNILVAVVRYYGGTKLGVGGLTTAYKTAARSAIESGVIKEKEIQEIYQLRCGYEHTGKVLHAIDKHQWEIISRKMTEECEFVVGIRISDIEKFKAQFAGSNHINIHAVNDY